MRKRIYAKKRFWRPAHYRFGMSRGTVVVEMAIALIFFLLMLFSVIDFARVMYSRIVAEHALREAGRFAVTGRQLADPSDPDTLLSRVASIVRVAQQSAPMLDMTGVEINGSPAGSPSASAGGANQTVTITLTYDLPLITPLIGGFFPTCGEGGHCYSFTASTTFRNEPFPS